MPERVLHLNQYADESELGVAVMDSSHSAVSAHAHDCFELVYVRSGFCLHEAAKQTALLIEGDFFLMRPGDVHKYVGTHIVELYNCLFSARAISEFLGELSALPGLELNEGCARMTNKLHLDLSEQKRVTRLFRGMIDDQRERAAGWKLRVRCQLACLLVDYSRACEKRATGGEHNAYPNYVTRALDIISARYANTALTVKAIAYEAGVSPDFLSRQFRALTGVGVQEYLRRYRFAKATELLLEGVSVGETSSRVGFASLCHFSREFKKELGATPTQYTRQNG